MTRSSFDDIDRAMRRREVFHGLRVPDGCYPIVRVDGRSFTTFTEDLVKPFDAGFHDWMVKTASKLLVELGGIYAYTESDEISVLLPADSDLFDREVEKLVSSAAGCASAKFAIESGEYATFDARIVVCANAADVAAYFRWRQADAWRCCVNSHAYWHLRNSGKSPRQATGALEGTAGRWRHDFLFANGVNPAQLPGWQRNGTGVYWRTHVKVGIDPRTGEEKPAERRVAFVDEMLPRGAEYASMLAGMMVP